MREEPLLYKEFYVRNKMTGQHLGRIIPMKNDEVCDIFTCHNKSYVYFQFPGLHKSTMNKCK